jgi:hypothetical protein
MTRRSTGLLASVLVGAALVAAPAQAFGANAKIGLRLESSRVVVHAQPDGGAVTANVQFRIQATIPAQVRIVPWDVAVDAAGALSQVAFGSTPYSLGPTLTFSPELIDVAPSDAEQIFKVTVSVAAAASDPPHIGMLGITLLPASASQGGDASVTQGLGMGVTVLSAPPEGGEAAIANARASLAATDFTMRRGAPWTLVDQVIPDLLPGLVDHGPATAVARFTNTGNVILDSTTKFQFSTVGPLAWLPGSSEVGSPFYTVTQLASYALPGQIMSVEADSLLRANDAAPFDMLPFVGFVRVAATTTAVLGSISADPITQSTVIFIFPWKELLALILLLVVLQIVRIVLRRGWRRLRGRGKGTQPVDVQDAAADTA